MKLFKTNSYLRKFINVQGKDLLPKTKGYEPIPTSIS